MDKERITTQRYCPTSSANLFWIAEFKVPDFYQINALLTNSRTRVYRLRAEALKLDIQFYPSSAAYHVVLGLSLKPLWKSVSSSVKWDKYHLSCWVVWALHVFLFLMESSYNNWYCNFSCTYSTSHPRACCPSGWQMHLHALWSSWPRGFAQAPGLGRTFEAVCR